MLNKASTNLNDDYLGNKYKILIVDNSPGLTGAYKSISAISCFLQREFDFFFCLPRHSAVVKASCALRPTITVPFLEIRKSLMTVFYLPRLLLNSLKLLRYVKRNKIDILHINDFYNMTGILVKKMYPSVRLVYHIRLLPTAYSGMLYPVWLSLVRKHADEIICVSQAGKKMLDKSLPVTVVSDAIEPCEIGDKRQRKQREETINLLYLANYTEGKGQDYAIQALARAIQRESRLRLLFVGGDLGLKKNIAYRQRLEALAAREKLADKVAFEGFASDTSSLFSQADIFLNFSDSESFSLTCLEALMHGVPVISTDSGGPAELFEPGISGMLVPVADIRAMASAMVKLGSDPTLRRALGQKGRQYASEKFTLAKSSGQLERVYLRLFVNMSVVDRDQ